MTPETVHPRAWALPLVWLWGLPPPLASVGGVVAVALSLAACFPSGEEGAAAIGTPAANAREAAITELWVAGGIEEHGGLVVESRGPWTASIGGDGHVVLAEPQAAAVHLLSPEGALLSRLGRRGQGPGELEWPGAAGFAGDTLVWVSDAGLGRMTLFSLDGDLRSTRARPPQQVPGSAWSVGPRQWLAGGSVLAAARAPQGAAPAGRVPLAVWDGADELRVLTWIESEVPGPRQVPSASGALLNVPQLYEGRPITGASQGGEWVFVLDRAPAAGVDGWIEIDRFEPGGAALGRIRIPYESLPLTREQRAHAGAVAENLREQLAPRLGEISLADLTEAIWVPDRHPPVRAAFADEGGFWIRRGGAYGGHWERYDLEGRAVARAELPSEVLAARGDRAVSLGRDSLGVLVVSMREIHLDDRRD